MRESAHKGRGKTDSAERVGKYNMKESNYKNYDELPLILNAKTVAKVLGVSPSSGYEMMHEPDFPMLKIGRAVRMSANTVRKYVCELEERRLISTESTTVTTRDGLKRNGNLLYTIRPIQLALDQFYEQQLTQMDMAAERQRVAKALALHSNSAHSA